MSIQCYLKSKQNIPDNWTTNGMGMLADILGSLMVNDIEVLYYKRNGEIYVAGSVENVDPQKEVATVAPLDDQYKSVVTEELEKKFGNVNIGFELPGNLYH